MPAPPYLTPAATQVIFEIESDVNAIYSKENGMAFGTIRLRGSSATIYSDGDIVLAKGCSFFQDGGYSYATTDESNILSKYTPPS